MVYPKGERVCTRYHNLSGELMFVVTSKPSVDFYFLYEVIDGTCQKLGKAKSPLELEAKFTILDRLMA